MEKQIKIRNVDRETTDAITITFERDDHLNGYESGQFINISEIFEGEKISRSYSFSSSPLVDVYPSVTIKRVANGKMSTYLTTELKKNNLINVSKPLGRFSIHPIVEEASSLLFIAGGSGITPLFSMIKTLLFSTQKTKVTLLYSNQNRDSIIFHDALNDLQQQFKNRFKVYHFLEHVSLLNHQHMIEGRITKERLKAILISEGPFRQFYLCGPSGMMESISSFLMELGVDPQFLHAESFKSELLKNNSVQPEEASTVTFLFQDRQAELKLSRSQFILQAALDNGISLPHSCKEALCGSCMVKVISGQIKMQENYALTDKQINDGLTLLCSGLPKSENITLSYLEL